MNKPLAPMPGSGKVPPISINRHWVLPPKPKPGRKPAVDTPPTKRKAQNREAQRAFRERRAARVGGLEEEMKRMEEEDRREQEELRGRIKQLESQVEEYSRMVMTWPERYREMEMALGRERQLRQNAEIEVEMLRKGMMNGTDAVALSPRGSTQNTYVGEQGAKEEGAHDPAGEFTQGCGKCSTTRCQCIEDVFEMSGQSNGDPNVSTFKRPHSPPSITDNKRARQNSNFDDDDAEIDFTAQFATSRPPTLTTSASSSSIPAMAPLDQCGFCSTGSICICAELSKENDIKPSPSLLPTSSQASANGVVSSGPCVKEPGTCAQCLSNPKSKSFCKSAAAARSSTLNNSNHVNGTALPTTGQTNDVSEPTLTCADTFITLSRHPGFDQATSEMSTWVPQLAAVRKPASRPDRTAYDIEAASVMSVLKLFDRRFAKEVAQAEQTNGAASPGGNRTVLPTRSNGAADDIEAKSWIAYEPNHMSGR